MIYTTFHAETQSFVFFIYLYFTMQYKNLVSDSFITESRISKHVVLHFSVIIFHLLHFSAHVTIWWWSDYSRCLLCEEGICIGFRDIVCPIGHRSIL